MRLSVITPVYNEWQAVGALARELDRELALEHRSAALLIIDDGSSLPPDTAGQGFDPSAATSIDILHLRHNLGHQRAIAIGFAYVKTRRNNAGVAPGADRVLYRRPLLERIWEDSRVLTSHSQKLGRQRWCGDASVRASTPDTCSITFAAPGSAPWSARCQLGSYGESCAQLTSDAENDFPAPARDRVQNELRWRGR